MNFSQVSLGAKRIVTLAVAAAVLGLTPAQAQDAAPADDSVVAEAVEAAPVDQAAAADGSTAEAAPGADSYTPLGPDMIKGRPTSADEDFFATMQFQDQYSEIGDDALFMHDVFLLPLITAISLFVLFLLFWVVIRFRRAKNPTPSRTTHNTALEVFWMVVPALILAVVAIPSIRLLAKQYEAPPENAVTIKATGYQWYWGYTYPDNGGFEVISNMMPEGEAVAKGLPGQLAVDNRMVVPAGVPLRIQTTAADVIHAFSVPSLWFKIDAVPGRLNERIMTIEEPGIYYGQCSELCGARHGYMPISVEALPMEQFEAWVRSQGGTVGDEAEPELEAAPLQEPESAVPDAAGAGEPAGAEAASTN